MAYGLTIVIVMLPVLLDDNWRAFWHDTIVYQANRTSPFSIWGLWGGLSIEQHLVQGAAIGLALAVAFVTVDGMPAVHFSGLTPNCRPV